MHRKPTGKTGFLSESADPGGPFKAINFPRDKAEIENLILRITMSSLATDGKALPWPAPPVRNLENHFDFTIPVDPPEYLDLMEVAPLIHSGYAAAPLHRNLGEFSDAIWERLTQKALSYGRAGMRQIHLLLYSTDIAFWLSPEVILSLGYRLSVSNRGITTVTYAMPWDEQSASVEVVYPRPRQDFAGFSLRRLYLMQSRLGDMTSAYVHSEGGIMVSFPPVKQGKS